jgi:hypothetical protein
MHLGYRNFQQIVDLFIDFAAGCCPARPEASIFRKLRSFNASRVLRACRSDFDQVTAPAETLGHAEMSAPSAA